MLDYCSYGFEVHCGFLIQHYCCLLFNPLWIFNPAVLLSAVLFAEINNGRTVIHLSYIFWGFIVCLAFVVGFFDFSHLKYFLLRNGRDLVLFYALTLSPV